MRYWWVNQNQTFKQEVEGGYLWSPKRNANGHRNPFYEFMREVAPGDLIFSFQKTFIQAIGIAQSVAGSAAKPAEFGSAGPNWSAIGWRVDVKYFLLDNPIRPVELMDQIGPLLPSKYAPLTKQGSGLQGIYLTFLPEMLADLLINRIGSQAKEIRQLLFQAADFERASGTRDSSVGQTQLEEHLIQTLQNDKTLADTERQSVILARRGQGQFKENVSRLESHCRVTKVDRIEHLRASHIKPWRDCGNYEERLEGANGLLLTPTIDHLFDRGYISFENSGRLLTSNVADTTSLKRMGLDTENPVNVGSFSEEQRTFLDHHRENVFLHAIVNRSII